MAGIVNAGKEGVPGETDALRTNARLAALVAAADDAIIGKDLDGIITDWNTGAERLFGYVAAEVLGRPITMLAPPGREDEIEELTTRMGRGETLPQLETQLRCRDGSLVQVSQAFAPIFDEDGQLLGSSVIARDITIRTIATALIASQKRVLEWIVQDEPLPVVLEELTRIIESQAPQPLFASILLLDNDGIHLRHGAAPSLPPSYTTAIDGTVIGPKVGSCGTAAFRREAVIVEDIAADPLWEDFRELALAHGLRACWSTPILGPDASALGTFALYYPQPRAPTVEERQMVDLLTRTATVAIERDLATAERDRLLARERETRERLEVALEAGQMGAWDWDARTGDVRWSPQLERLHGLAPGAFGGSFATFFADVHPDDQERVRSTITASLASGEHQLDYRIVWPDGSVHWVEARGRVVRDAAGAALGMRGICMDVTARKQADELQQRLAAIVESSDDTIIGKTLDGVITNWNAGAERMYGYTAEEAIGRPVGLLAPPDRPDEIPSIMARLRRGEAISQFETERLHKDGTRLAVALTISPIRDATGRVIGASTIARNITARRQAEAERERLLARERAARAEAEGALRVRDAVMSFATHDLRTPLTTIKGQAQVLARLAGRDRLTPELLTVGLERIDIASKKMEALIGELMDSIRLQAGQQLDLRREPVDLVALARRCAADYQRTTDRHTIAVQADLTALVGEYDPVRMERVLGNLLTNAIKYSPAGGPITLTVAEVQQGDDTWAALAVRDEGLGIPAADLPRIFERFHRAANVPEQIAGSGIGLAGAKVIVEQHGGTLTAESVEGAGSTFTLRLPVTLTAEE